MSSIRLDQALWLQLVPPNDAPPTSARFLKALKSALAEREAVAEEGAWDVKTTLEGWMKLAQHRATAATLLEGAQDTALPPEESLEAARALTDEIVTLSVWLSTRNAPAWTFSQLDAVQAYRACAHAVLRNGDPRQAFHWVVGLFLLPSTLLGRTVPAGGLLLHDDIQLLLRLQALLPPETFRDEAEAWHDLYISYGLFSS